MPEHQPAIYELSWYGFSSIMLMIWLWRNHGGRTAFASVPSAKHTLSGIDAMVVVFSYFLFQVITAMINKRYADDGWGGKNITYLVSIAGMLITAGAVVWVGAIRFDGGVRGFGLTVKKPAKLLVRTLGYSAVIFGLVFMVLMVTLAVCKLFGYEEIQKHLFLEMLQKNPPKLTVAIVVFSAVLVAPVVEELIFRGIVQCCFIRLFGQVFEKTDPAGGPSHKARWLGIAAVSAFFALVHADWQHMPALFVLSMALGYVREKHGSLTVPIAIHSLFNLLPITLTIAQHVK